MQNIVLNNFLSKLYQEQIKILVRIDIKYTVDILEYQ